MPNAQGFDNRVYSKGEEPGRLVATGGPNKYNRYFYLKVGQIIDVDYDVYRILVRWISGGGGQGSAGSPSWIPITFAYCGPAGCMGMVPEKNSIGVFGYYDEGEGKGSPLLLTYLPASLDIGLENNALKIRPDSVANEDTNVIQYRFRKLNKGEIIVASPLGSSLLTSDNIELIDSVQDSFQLRSSDQSIIANSINNFMFADGASVRSGLAIRNSMNLFNPDGSRIEDTNGRELSLKDGEENIYIVPFGRPIEYDTQFYSEYRVDVDELGDNNFDSNDVDSYSPLSTRDPVVSFALGNLIGANESEKTYGQILRPILFNSRNDREGSFN